MRRSEFCTLLLIHWQFGPSVLLDLVWDVDKLVHPSKSFRNFLTALSTGSTNTPPLDSRDVFENLVDDSQQSLKSVLSTMGGVVMCDYYDDFVRKYPRVAV